MNGLVEYWKSELHDDWVRTEAYENTLKKNMKLKQILLNDSDTPKRSDVFKSNDHYRIMRRFTDINKSDALQSVWCCHSALTTMTILWI